jgi:hypothetical protein
VLLICSGFLTAKNVPRLLYYRCKKRFVAWGLMNMNETPKPIIFTRHCRRCGKAVDVKNFSHPRIKTCLPCQVARARDALVFDEHTKTLQPARALGPALTTTVEGYNKYQREYARARAKKRNDPLFLPESKLCRRCQRRKPLSEFGSWRVRICLACDGPTLESLLRR